MFKKLKQIFNLKDKNRESEIHDKYELFFPKNRLQAKGEKGEDLNIIFPMAAWLADVVETKYPDLHAEAMGKSNISEQFAVIAKHTGREEDLERPVDAACLSLLIHLEYGDVLKTIQEKYPQQYQAAIDNDESSEFNPLQSTVRLLEQFGVTERRFPECYEKLEETVLTLDTVKNPANFPPSP